MRSHEIWKGPVGLDADNGSRICGQDVQLAIERNKSLWYSRVSDSVTGDRRRWSPAPEPRTEKDLQAWTDLCGWVLASSAARAEESKLAAPANKEGFEVENAARAFAAKHGGFPCEDDDGAWLILKPRAIRRNLAWRMPPHRPYRAGPVKWTHALTWKLSSARRSATQR